METTIVNKSLIKLITLYQQYISPHKGYCCAHSAYHGGMSCSSWAIYILQKKGLSDFFPLMKQRFLACSEASSNLKEGKLKTTDDSETVDECPCANRQTAYCCLGVLPIPW